MTANRPPRRRPGPALCLGLAAWAAACGDGPAAPEPAPRIEILGEQPIAAVAGATVPVAIRVVDYRGAAVAGASVSWAAAPGAGSVTAHAAATDAQGNVMATWTLGTTAGEQSLAVVADASVSATIRAAVAPGAPATIALPADTVRLSAFRESIPLAARVEDAFGNDIAGLDAAWMIVDTLIAVIDGAGRLTARDRGMTAVVASLGELADTAIVHVDPRGAITVTFDDGWRSTFTHAYPVLAEHGIRANVAVITGTTSFPAYLDLDQLKALHEAGWSLVSHTVNHSDLTQLPDSMLEQELRDSKAWLEAQGFRHAPVFIVPYHTWGERERAAIARHYGAARGYTFNQFPADSLVQWRPADPYVLTGVEAQFMPFTTPEGRQRIRDYLDRAAERGEFVDLFFHQLQPEDVPAFTELVLILVEYGDRVRTYDELFDDPGS